MELKIKFTRILNLILPPVSLMATPLILFISTANALFLQNQDDLNHDLHYLIPFVLLFFVTWLFGSVIYYLSRYSFFQSLLWLYYLTGPFFLILTFLRKSQIFPMEIAYIVFVAFVIIISIILLLKFNPINSTQKFAIFTVFLLLSEIYIWATKYKTDGLESIRQSVKINNSEEKKQLPNIYHILLDGYQSDTFDFLLTPEIRVQLKGFTLYPRNSAVYRFSKEALSSIFSGRTYDTSIPQKQYLINAFNSDHSFLYWLKTKGYSTTAYYYPILKFDLNLIDYQFPHNIIKIPSPITDYKTFIHTWIYSYLPYQIGKKVIDKAILDQIKNKDISPGSWPIVSYYGFQKFMEHEKIKLSDPNDSGRYTFIELLIPHDPIVLRSDCSFDIQNRMLSESLKNDNPKTTLEEQCNCANKIILDFIDLLKKHDRYKNSLIIIHADHGLYTVIKDGKIIRNIGGMLARSKALMLIKPIGKGDETPFTESMLNTTLMDIAPTIIKSAGLKIPAGFEGSPLIQPDLSLFAGRIRYFHSYKYTFKTDPESMTRYIIKDDRLVFDKKINLSGI